MCMDRATLCRVDAGRVDAGMTEDVSQPGKVMVDEVEQPDKKMPQIMRKDFFWGDTLAYWHKAFISRQMLLLSSGLPLRVVNTGPLRLLRLRRYVVSSLRRAVGRNTIRRLPLLLISALPMRTDSAVIKRSSDTRIPVEQSVWITSISLSLPRAFAALTSHV